MTTVLCRLADLAPTGAKEVVIEDAGIRHTVFVVRHAGRVAAYFNVCPHARLPLNAAPNVFFDISNSFLVCTNHGAHFDAAAGRCIRGPCKGESLKSVPVRIDGDRIVCTESDYAIPGA